MANKITYDGNGKSFEYKIQFMGRQHGEQIISRLCNYPNPEGNRLIDTPPYLITIWRFDPRKKSVRRDYKIVSPIIILEKREIL